MRILKVGFTPNLTKTNTRKTDVQNTVSKNSAKSYANNNFNVFSNPISFGVKLSENSSSTNSLQIPSKYSCLMNVSNLNSVSNCNSDEIINLLEKLKDDKDVSPEQKREILLSPNGTGDNFHYIVKYRDGEYSYDEVRKLNQAYRFKIVEAMLAASPDSKTTEALLTTENSDGHIPLDDAVENVVKLIVTRSPKEVLEKQLTHKVDGKSTFARADRSIRELMLKHADDKIKSQLLPDPHYLFPYNMKPAIKMAEDMEDKSIAEQTIKAILQAKCPETGANILHGLARNCEGGEYAPSPILYKALELYKKYPDLLKDALLCKDKTLDKIPAEQTASNANFRALLTFSPNEETLGKQFNIIKTKCSAYDKAIAILLFCRNNSTNTDGSIVADLLTSDKYSDKPLVSYLDRNAILDIVRNIKNQKAKNDILSNWSSNWSYRDKHGDKHPISECFNALSGFGKEISKLVEVGELSGEDALNLIAQYINQITSQLEQLEVIRDSINNGSAESNGKAE